MEIHDVVIGMTDRQGTTLYDLLCLLMDEDEPLRVFAGEDRARQAKEIADLLIANGVRGHDYV